MRRIMMAGSRAFAGAAALSLSIAAVAPAQQAQPDPAPLTEAQTAGVRRLKEVIEVLNTGDYATIRAYVEANSVHTVAYNPPNQKTFPWEKQALSQILARYRGSHGVDLVRVTTQPVRGDALRPDVVGIVRNRLTGDEEYLAVAVESQPPHRITWLPNIPAADVATLGLKRTASVAATEQERLEEIGSYLKRMGDAGVFSGSVIIARDGKPVLAQAYGYADREKKIPNTVDTPFLMASMTKLFTGLAIGQLVEQGKLSYDDPLAKFLPDFPDAESAKKIRIKHLLSHTAGLGDGLAPLANPDWHDARTTVKAYVETFERKPPAFEPGTKWAYSNMSFVLLGRVIELVTGQDYYDYMQKNVFAPAGAKSASFPLLPRNGVAVVPMAYPYDYRWDEENDRWYEDNYLGQHGRRGSSAGGSIVSALDLLKLSNAINDGRIVKPETFRLHSSPKPELGSPNYGYGFIATIYGRPFVGHNGRAFGHCTDFGELRDTPYTIIVLSNLTRGSCGEVVGRILRVLRPT
jgi:CubicO group peptidase (beta-lactamase class C family)